MPTRAERLHRSGVAQVDGSGELGRAGSVSRGLGGGLVAGCAARPPRPAAAAATPVDGQPVVRQLDASSAARDSA